MGGKPYIVHTYTEGARFIIKLNKINNTGKYKYLVYILYIKIFSHKSSEMNFYVIRDVSM